ncbi:MAG: type II secretion system F family protein [Acidimicrobiales bacterium]|nr:type II secretion system F family protein [Acidimicrobiales bacterium]
METLLGALFLAAGVAVVLFGLSQRSLSPATEGADEYLRSLDEVDEETDEFSLLLAQPFLARVVRPMAGNILSTIGSLLPHNMRDQVHHQLIRAGLTGQFRAEEIISLQVLGGIVGVLLGIYIVVGGVIGGGLGLLAGILAPVALIQVPRSWLDRKVKERMEAIRRDLPDMLDLLAISVEAGVGFEGALAVVCDSFSSPLADEFARTLREMELGLSRREALQNLKKRTEVPELSNFVLTLTQADALGMPVGRVLKTAADEMRSKRRQWAREKAAKLPVKILFPLVLFIFPPIFIILLGPATSQIVESFDSGAFG